MRTVGVIDNSADIIDSRDVIERIAELRSTVEEDGIDGLDDGERHELAALEALAEEAEGYAPDWQYGETLIRDSYFKAYAMELADDIGAVDLNASWPMSCIDWDQAARELQMDYTAVTFDGVDYWIR